MTKQNDAKARLNELATRLASELGIDSLEVRNLDRYDFHEVHVAALKRVLQRAFVLGMQAAGIDDGGGPVDADDGCPNCGERRCDALLWTGSDVENELQCQTCSHVYAVDCNPFA